MNTKLARFGSIAAVALLSIALLGGAFAGSAAAAPGDDVRANAEDVQKYSAGTGLSGVLTDDGDRVAFDSSGVDRSVDSTNAEDIDLIEFGPVSDNPHANADDVRRYATGVGDPRDDDNDHLWATGVHSSVQGASEDD